MPADSTSLVDGFVAQGYESVREAFADNFSKRGELGAACAIYRDGRPVVDLWGGYRDKARNARWEERTQVLVYSLTKGITALTVATAVSNGLFGYEQSVHDIWPEFGVCGKQRMTVRELLSQKGGLAALDLKLTPATMADHGLVARFLARQEPNWKPGDHVGNHAHTLGFLASELIRRTDVKGRTLGEYFEDKVAGRLGVKDFHIGLPESFDESGLARIDAFGLKRLLLPPWHLPLRMIVSMIIPWTLTARTLNNPRAIRGPGAIDKPEFWRIENGGAGGIGNARAIAHIYSEFATGGQTLGIEPDVLAALAADAERPVHGWHDQVIKTDVVYSLGLEKPSASNKFGTSGAAFGTFAVGGSFAYADPKTKVGYAYVTNRIVPHLWGEPREYAVRQAFDEVCADHA